MLHLSASFLHSKPNALRQKTPLLLIMQGQDVQQPALCWLSPAEASPPLLPMVLPQPLALLLHLLLMLPQPLGSPAEATLPLLPKALPPSMLQYPPDSPAEASLPRLSSVLQPPANAAIRAGNAAIRAGNAATPAANAAAAAANAATSSGLTC
jgi:hypothetical protein